MVRIKTEAFREPVWLVTINARTSVSSLYVVDSGTFNAVSYYRKDKFKESHVRTLFKTFAIIPYIPYKS